MTFSRPTYLDIRSEIERTGRYDTSLIMRAALISARGDWALCKAEGLTSTTWRMCLAAALRRAWHVARSAMEYRAYSHPVIEQQFQIAAE